MVDPEYLNQLAIYLDGNHVRTILETLHAIGSHHINYGLEEFIILWNNRSLPGLTYKSRVWVEGHWLDQTMSRSDQGQMPRFKAFRPTKIASDIEDSKVSTTLVKWDINVNYFDLINLRFSSQDDSAISL
jgi:hypothetical protein